MGRPRICRYNFGIELGQFDEKENKVQGGEHGNVAYTGDVKQ